MKQYFYLFTLFFLLVISCRKDKIIVYEGSSGLVFLQPKELKADSLTYTFAINTVPKIKDTVYVPLQLTGWVSKEPRDFVLQIDPSSTAKKGMHFEFTKMIFPANATQFLYPIVILKTPDMDTQMLQLKLTVGENSNFSGGAPGYVSKFSQEEFPQAFQTFSTFKVNMTAMLSKPSTWTADVNAYFGTYSNEKFLFMIQILGVNDFRTVRYGGIYNGSDILNIQQRLRFALDEYEKEHGSRKKDENGVEIKF